ncbi:tetratricopeptide repeat protein [Cognatishimia sp. SS12]|uniref:tetratricopeptide repeat protein n=1 Tax=Cognatishimia sp. SS12 TaxID=2979465 RepID=UPI00232EAD21|nr:tetratricopeptide repeat protein [Cognatishimia sp. SS12]MDC0738700.1 tetratricopeptide repeat protein [Cognatishimia sp. SS12]
MKMRLKQIGRWARGALLVGWLSPAALWAEPLPLAFHPPEIAAAPVCVARRSDAETLAFWSAWDGKSAPEMSAALIRRDIKRLQYLDARKWIGTIEQMIDLLERRAAHYGGKNALLTRIEALQAAGQIQRIRSERLVQALAEGADQASPRIQNALSRFYRAGIGVAPDAARADELLFAAGYGGNADALLALSKRSLDGAPVAGWDVAESLAITMAFGALVGELNDTICDRTSRIAREYHNGEIVQKDAGLALAWFRFGADLGDVNAAWKVAEYHLRAEDVPKDNAVLMTYLTQAAEGGLPFAQVELGRLYEAGALLPQNLPRALTLYRAAADTGSRAGLTRLALFLEEHAADFPQHQAERGATLAQLAARADAPGWVFTRLAQDAERKAGRWAARPEVLALLKKASVRDDLDGSNRYALALLADGPSPAEFDQATSLLGRLVSVQGGVTPSKQLFAAYMCQAPDGPHIAEARHWEAMEVATGTANVNLDAHALADLHRLPQAVTLAKLQSQALYGRPTSLASWLQYLAVVGAADAQQAFWASRAEEYELVVEARHKATIRAAEADLKAPVLALLAQQSAAGAAAAAPQLPVIWPMLTLAEQTAALESLEVMAAQGNGASMRAIAAISRQPAAEIYARYAEAIARSGDSAAHIFALPHVSKALRGQYFARAIGLMSCDYKTARALADVAAELGEATRARKWLRIAAELTEDNLWAEIDLANAKLRILGPDALPEALAVIEAASAAGDTSARIRLFELLLLPEAASFDMKRAVVLLREAQSDPGLLSALLGRFRRADQSVQRALAEELDVPAIFRVAAEAGDIYAMRGYGQMLRDQAETPSDLAVAMGWLQRAAEGGDVTAMSEYGQALALGLGVPAQPDAALKWLARAAEHGQTEAAEIMRLVAVSQQVTP